MSITKIPCLYQGVGKENPAYLGGYDLIRPVNDPLNPDYWITSGETTVFDAAANNGTGADLHFYDRLRISKGAEGDCNPTVTLDLEANPLVFSYYPPHSLDVIFVLDVTASMMSGGSRKMALAKRALIQTINLLWQQNKETRVTIVPFARDAYVPGVDRGFSYDYLGTLFTWRRSTTSGNLIGQILGYRNGSFVSSTDMTVYMEQSAPIAASTQLSLYNYYRYYQIQYTDIYNDDGSAKADTVLQEYLSTVYAANPSAYTGNFITAVAASTPLTPSQLPYSMNDSGYENNTILDNMIWAIPYGEDTNTEAGLEEAYILLKTPGFTQSDDILRRAVVLITDGQANRSVNPEYRGVYAKPTSVNSDFLPDTAGEPWKYYLYLRQTLPTLLGEIANRSATSEELVLALQRAYEAALRVKNPSEGNASLFVLGIEIDAQTPGPYTRDDVLNIMRTIASTGSYLREATENGSESPIIEELERLVRDLFVLTGSLQLTIVDTINKALFYYVPGSIKITGWQDGLRLKSVSDSDIIDPADPDYTIYVKPALLPDVGDANIHGDTIVIDLGKVPFPLASPDSRTQIRITYDLANKGSAHGTHLHTNYDERTYVTFLEPNHLVADASDLSYNQPSRLLNFPSPIVACSADFSIKKFVGSSADNVNYKEISISACRNIYYRVMVENYTDTQLTFPLLYDVQGAETIEEALVSQNRRILAENLVVPAHSAAEFPFYGKTDCRDTVLSDFAVLETGTTYLYDNASATVIDGTASYTVQYLNCCTGKRIIPDQTVTNVSACICVSACHNIRCIPGFRFVCAKPYHINLCNGENVIRLYYAPRC
ncbi:MAG: vWA domain-containing protein [Emergencia timonensis]|uniref:vWA domain-containing protein n=2 Tax=Emergencia timonensis TaxID=1776384 RepID=UPI00082CAEBA|nr:vWA domain-containing protein [Emergencia timonensis]